MNWEKFKNKFHPSWHKHMKTFIESNECNEIYKFLKMESERGKSITPSSTNLYRPFLETPLNDIKCIILGDTPYLGEFDGVPVADGFLLSCGVTNKILPALSNFYMGIEMELHNGLNLSYYESPNVDHLAEQGVLMLNTSLTTESSNSKAHTKLWIPFIEYLIKNVFTITNVPIILLGDASRFKECCTFQYLELEHPKNVNKGSTWDTKGVFTKVNKIIKENNNFKIKWLYDDVPF